MDARSLWHSNMIDKWIHIHFATTYTTESDEDSSRLTQFLRATTTQKPLPCLMRLSQQALLMLWLKCYIVPTPPREVVAIDVIYPAILLAYVHPLCLLSAMVCRLQSGFENQSINSATFRKLRKMTGTSLIKTSNPRVELPYTYQRVWFVKH